MGLFLVFVAYFVLFLFLPSFMKGVNSLLSVEIVVFIRL